MMGVAYSEPRSGQIIITLVNKQMYTFSMFIICSDIVAMYII